MIAPIIRLLQAGAKFAGQSAKLANALTGLVNAIVTGSLSIYLGLSDGDLEALRKWWQGAPQEQAQSQPLPVLSKEAEALYFRVVQLMENQQQVDELKRYILTLPALPEEGY